jgi:hypothetical protein
VTCLQEKDEEEFNWRHKPLGIRHKTCRECHHVCQDNWYQKNKAYHLENVRDRKKRVRDEAREYVWNYLAMHPCQSCGASDRVVLEFHHREGKDKAISEMLAGGYPIHATQAEIDKCDVLCANCHRKITHTTRGWFRGRK